MIDALTLDQLRMFVAVADCGSFRAAAGRVRRVQSAVSHAIANLEAQLGVPLFDRTSLRPTMTAQGRLLLADARAVLQRADALRARAQGFGEGVELELTLAVDALFPLPEIASALTTLHAAYPTVGVRSMTMPLGGAIEALRERRCTLAITALPLQDPQLTLEAMAPSTLIAVAAARHALAAAARDGAPLTAADLADHLQIVVEDSSVITEGRDFGVLSPGTWRVGDLHSKHALLLAGCGWGSLPQWLVEHDLAAGRLVRVPVAALGAEGESHSRFLLAHRSDEALGPAARHLRECLLPARR